MTSRESEVLQHLAHCRGPSSLSSIAERLGVSQTYARLICASLYARYYVDKEPGEIFTLMPAGRRVLERRGGADLASPAVPEARADQIDPATVRTVADTLSAAVQRSIHRQLRRSAVPLPSEREPIAIKRSFEGLTEAAPELDTNLAEPAEEHVEAETVGESIRALQDLRVRR